MANTKQKKTVSTDVKNLEITIVEDEFHLKGKLDTNYPLSGSGKSRSAFTTGGNKDTGLMVKNPATGKDMELKVGLNIFASVKEDSDDEAAAEKMRLVEAKNQAEEALAASKNV